MDGASFKSTNSQTSIDQEETLLKTPRASTSTASSFDIPAISLPSSSTAGLASPEQEDLASSVHEATSSSLFDTPPRLASPSPPSPPPPPPPPPAASSSSLPPPSSSSTAPSSRSPSPHRPATSSADLILPLLIYLVVRHNPPQFTSHLLFVQRFHAESLLRGEASYCATNFSAVVEFLNEVDIGSLGLSSAQISRTSSLGVSPLGIPAESLSSYERRTSSSSSSVPTYSTVGSLPTPSGKQRVVIKARVSEVTQELDKFVDEANSAIVKTLESSLKMFFGPKGIPKTVEDVKKLLDGEGDTTSLIAGTGALRRKGQGERTVAGYGAVEERRPQDGTAERAQGEAATKVLGSTEEGKSVVAGASTFGNRLASIPGLGRLASMSGVGGGSGTTTPSEMVPSSLLPKVRFLVAHLISLLLTCHLPRSLLLCSLRSTPLAVAGLRLPPFRLPLRLHLPQRHSIPQ